MIISAIKSGSDCTLVERLKEIISNKKGEEKVKSIVLVKKDKVNEEFRELGIYLKKGYRSRSKISNQAYACGIIAGDKVNISSPVKNLCR